MTLTPSQRAIRNAINLRKRELEEEISVKSEELVQLRRELKALTSRDLYDNDDEHEDPQRAVMPFVEPSQND